MGSKEETNAQVVSVDIECEWEHGREQYEVKITIL